MSNEDETRKHVEEDTIDDLELTGEQADDVVGGDGTSAGSGAGKVTTHAMTFTKTIDAATPNLG